MSKPTDWWKIYYGEGQPYTGSPEFAPKRNVQIIKQVSREHGWQALAGSDYYIWRDSRWVGVDKFGLYDYLIDPGFKIVLFGRTLTKEEFNTIWQQAMADPDSPQKTAFDKRERRPD